MLDLFNPSAGPEKMIAYTYEIFGGDPLLCYLEPDPLLTREVGDVSFLADLLPVNCFDLIPPSSKVQLTEKRVRISRRNVPYLGQLIFRMDALTHYCESPDALFDEQGYYDNHLPVVFDVGGSLVVLDGTHRVLAALWCDREIEAVVAVEKGS